MIDSDWSVCDLSTLHGATRTAASCGPFIAVDVRVCVQYGGRWKTHRRIYSIILSKQTIKQSPAPTASNDHANNYLSMHKLVTIADLTL